MSRVRAAVAASLAVAFCGLPAHAQRDSSPQPPALIAAVVHGFEFVDPPRCASRDPDWCAVAGPSAWADVEIEQMRHWLGALLANERTRDYVLFARSHGYRRIWRFRSGFTFIRQAPQPSANPLWVSHALPLKGVHVADTMFQVSPPDPVAGFAVQQLSLMHEVFHAIDHVDSWSGQATFQELYARYMAGLDPGRCARLHDRLVEALENGTGDSAYREARLGALALGVPSPFVCAGEREGFAEIAAYLTLDPSSDASTPPYIADFFRANVFPRYKPD